MHAHALAAGGRAHSCSFMALAHPLPPVTPTLTRTHSGPSIIEVTEDDALCWSSLHCPSRHLLHQRCR